MDLNTLIMIFVAIIGLCLGSFYNVVILRSLSNESIVFPPSKCPKCNNRLKWWHNIPVISYILLGGKCYFCKEKISIQYPIVELLTMFLFILTVLSFGLNLKTLFLLCWISALIIMTATDIKERIVDCNLAIFMAVLGVVYNIISNGWKGLLFSVLGLIICAVVIELVARLGYLVAKTRAMGEADTYVAGALGAIMGLHGVIPVLACSLLTAMLFVFPVFLYKKYKRGDYATLIIGLLFALSTVVHELFIQNLLTLSLLIGFGGALAYRVIKNMKQSEELTYFPFVPALTISAMLCFWFIL